MVERVRDGRLEGGTGGVGEPVLRTLHGRDQVRGPGGPADLPAGEGEGLARAGDRHRPVEHARQGGDRDVGVAVEGQVLVDLVGDHDEVVATGDVRDGGELALVEHASGRVVRAVQQDHPGAVGDDGLELVGVEAVVGCAQGHRASYAARELDRRAVAVVVGLADDHLVTRVDQPEHGRCDRLGGAGRDHDLVGRELETVVALLVPDDRLDELGGAVAGWVLVPAGPHGVVRRFDDGGRAALVGEPLTEVDRPGAYGESRHLGEDRAPDAAQPFGPPGPAWGCLLGHAVEPNSSRPTCAAGSSTTMAG